MRIDLWPGRDVGEFMPYMETFLLDTPAPRGAVIVCPGGGYSHRAPHEGNPVAERFNALGFHAFVVEYRVRPTRFPEPQQDAFRAIKIVRQHAAEWKVIPNQIAIGGFSSGGHLAASTGVFFDEVDASFGDGADAFPQRPDALILCYPVIDVDPKRFGHEGSAINLCHGETPTQADFDRFSLELHVKAQTPPAFLWHTADDGVKVQNSLSFANAVWAQGGIAEMHIFAQGPHGLGLAPKYPDIQVWPELAGKFLVCTCKFQAE